MDGVTGRLARLGLTVVLAILAVPVVAAAQPATKVARIGYLLTGSLTAPETQASLEAFRRGLREHGYLEGQNIVVEYRAADGRLERLPALAAELTRLKVDLIVAVTTPGARAAQQATTTIPIVGSNMGDPVRDGLVGSLAKPGGNVTGTAFLGPELVPKRLELLREALPGVSRVGMLWHPGAFGERTMRDMMTEADGSARRLGLQLRFVEVRAPDEFERAFDTLTRERADALFVFPSTLFFTERKRLAGLAAKHRIPLLGNAREYAQAGALIAYGASIPDGARRTAAYVDKILKGARPADLPIEQPTTFHLIVNLKTARALRLTLPPTVLARADELIE
jgi:putative ABC transport system substrate-binding protein